jgi:hypothetical protein
MPEDQNDQNTGTGNADAGQNGTDSWTPPTREEWEKHQADLKKANAEAANRKRQLAEQTKQSETETEKAKREAAEVAKSGFLPFLVKSEAKAAFLAEGADAAKVAKLTRLLDMSKIEMDGDELVGLEDQVAELKADFPELFKQKSSTGTGDDEGENQRPAPPRIPRVNTTQSKPGPARELSPAEKIAEKLLRGR